MPSQGGLRASGLKSGWPTIRPVTAGQVRACCDRLEEGPTGQRVEMVPVGALREQPGEADCAGHSTAGPYGSSFHARDISGTST